MAKEDAADLVQRDVGHAVVEVVGDGAHEARKHGAAHLGLVGDERVDDLHRDTTALLGDTKAHEVVGVGEAIGAGLGESTGAQGLANEANALLLHGQAAGVVPCGGKRGLDVALAPQAADLLDEIDLAGEVGTVGGGGHREVLVVNALDAAAQARKAGDHELVGDLGAAEHTGASGAEVDDGSGDDQRIDVHDAGAHLGTAALLKEGGGDLGDVCAVGAIDLALVADGGLAHEVEVAARAGDVAGGERGALEKDVHGVLVDLGVHAAHDAGKGDRGLAVVGDDGHVRREGALDAIEGLKLLAICGGADDDVAATVALGELAQVKGVQRLAGEEHDVIGHVDDVVDGAAAGGHDAAGQPLGRRADLDVADHAGGVALAELGVVDGDVDEVVGIGALLALDGGQLNVGVLVVHGGNLDGHASHGQAVRAVGRDLAVDDGVGHAEIVGVVHADGGVLGQDDDAVVVVSQAELAGGAVHAAGLDAAQLALLDLEVTGQDGADHGRDDVVALLEVLRAADDLQRDGVAVGVDVAVADGDLAEPHVVGVGVGLLADDLGGHDVGEVGADLLDGLDLGAGADELGDEVGGVLRHVDHALEPLV